MPSAKRVWVASLCGILFGVVCASMASRGSSQATWPILVTIITSRALIGLAIGLSGWAALHWAAHGAVLGFLFSIPLAFGALGAPQPGPQSVKVIFIATIISGIIYGVLIELITSVLLKARIRRPETH